MEPPCKNNFESADIRAVANAIEADAGEVLPDLMQALQEAKDGSVGRTTTPHQILVRLAREKSGLAQAVFAERIDTPLVTLIDWELGRSAPPGAVLCLLRLLVRHPELFRELD